MNTLYVSISSTAEIKVYTDSPNISMITRNLEEKKFCEQNAFGENQHALSFFLSSLKRHMQIS